MQKFKLIIIIFSLIIGGCKSDKTPKLSEDLEFTIDGQTLKTKGIDFLGEPSDGDYYKSENNVVNLEITKGYEEWKDMLFWKIDSEVKLLSSKSTSLNLPAGNIIAVSLCTAENKCMTKFVKTKATFPPTSETKVSQVNNIEKNPSQADVRPSDNISKKIEPVKETTVVAKEKDKQIIDNQIVTPPVPKPSLVETTENTSIRDEVIKEASKFLDDGTIYNITDKACVNNLVAKYAGPFKLIIKPKVPLYLKSLKVPAVQETKIVNVTLIGTDGSKNIVKSKLLTKSCEIPLLGLDTELTPGITYTISIDAPDITMGDVTTCVKSKSLINSQIAISTTGNRWHFFDINYAY